MAEAARQSGWLAATLETRDDLLGLGLVDAAAVEAVDGGPDLSEQDTLDCAPSGVPFRMAWLAEGRCERSSVLGARVLLEVW